MKKPLIYLITIFLLVAVPLFSLSFKWAFLYKQADNEDPQTIDYQSISTQLTSGDQIKIYFRPISNAYIYFFLQDAQEELYLLFPEVISDFNRFYSYNKNYYVPGGDNWFFLDDVHGTEKFYLLVSNERLTGLENLMENYLEYYYSNPVSEDALMETRQMVIEEIKRIRLEQAMGENLREDIVLVACDFRGIGDLYEFNAVEVEADRFYAKTIRIEH